jgi:hypothetical protein
MVGAQTRNPPDPNPCEEGTSESDRTASIGQRTYRRDQRVLALADFDLALPEQCVSDGDPIGLIEPREPQLRVLISMPAVSARVSERSQALP